MDMPDLSLNQDDITLIREGMMFSNLAEDQLLSVLAVSRAIELEKGSTLFVQNQPALHF